MFTWITDLFIGDEDIYCQCMIFHHHMPRYDSFLSLQSTPWFHAQFDLTLAALGKKRKKAARGVRFKSGLSTTMLTNLSLCWLMSTNHKKKKSGISGGRKSSHETRSSPAHRVMAESSKRTIGARCDPRDPKFRADPPTQSSFWISDSFSTG